MTSRAPGCPNGSDFLKVFFVFVFRVFWGKLFRDTEEPEEHFSHTVAAVCSFSRNPKFSCFQQEFAMSLFWKPENGISSDSCSGFKVFRSKVSFEYFEFSRMWKFESAFWADSCSGFTFFENLCFRREFEFSRLRKFEKAISTDSCSGFKVLRRKVFFDNSVVSRIWKSEGAF